MPQDTPFEEQARIARFFDFRIPLWRLLCCGAAAAYFIIGTRFTSNQTAKDMSELQITVKAGNQQVTTLAGEQALLRFRMENIEGEMRAIKAQALQNAGTSPPSTTTPRRYP